jgi:hypothetical protein
VALRQLTDQEKANYKKETEQAKRMHNSAPGRTGSIFGEKANRVQSQARKAAITQDFASAASSSEVAPSQQQLESYEALRKHAAKIERLDATTYGAKQRRDKLAAKAIQQWQESAAAVAAHSAAKDLLGTGSFEVVPGLGSHGSICMLDSTSYSSHAERLLENVGMWGKKGSNKIGNLIDALRLSFKLKGRRVEEDVATEAYQEAMAALGNVGQQPAAGAAGAPGAVNPGPGPKQKNGKPDCWEAGVCLCSDAGKSLWSMIQRFLGTIKQQFPVVSPFRQAHLKDSKVLVLIRSRNLSQSDDPPVFTGSHLVHIGVHYLNPFKPTFRVCELTGRINAAGEINATGTNCFITLFPFIAQLDRGLAWFAKFYWVQESNRPLPSMEPTRVRALQYTADVGQQFWPPTRRARAAADNGDDAPDGCDRLAPLRSKDLENLEDELDDEEDPDEQDGREEEALTKDLLDDGMAAMEAEIVAAAGEEVEDHGPHHPDEESDDEADRSCDSEAEAQGKGEAEGDEADEALLRGKADLAVRVSGGVIRYYESRKHFVATCDKHSECGSQCKLTRQGTPAASTSKLARMQAKGRPLGYMVCWLAAGCDHTCPTKAQHWDAEWINSHCAFAARAAARTLLSESLAGRNMLAMEREKRADEGDEPTGLA